MSRRLLLLARGALGFLCTGCGCAATEDGSDAPTSAIYPEFTVVAAGDGRSQAEALLRVVDPASDSYYDLEAGSVLEVTVDGESKVLERVGPGRYSATFEIDFGGTEFVFALLRPGLGDAPLSIAVLPEPFELEVAPGEATRGVDSVTLSWSPVSEDSLALGVSGPCLRPIEQGISDDGTHTIDADELELEGTESDAAECDATVVLERSRLGSLDPAFDAGAIVAAQLRSASFLSLAP